MLKSIKYGRLLKTNPALDLEYIRMLRALYKGGKTLLGDDKVMERVFPRHANEGKKSYEERRARAFYENAFAQVVNKVVAGLGQDPLTLDPPPDADGKAVEGAQLDDYWKQLQKDATPPNDDGEAKTFDQILRAVGCEGFVTGRAWVLCDMPPASGAASRKEQEDAGELDAYPVVYRSDQVTDWYESGGVLKWIRSYCCTVLGEDPTADREWTRHEWRIWTAEDWTTYAVELDKNGKDRRGHRVDANTDIAPDPALSGVHKFGRVPWVMFDCAADDEPQMFIGDLIESQVRNFFNQACGDAYQRLRHMFQQLYEFLGSETGSIGGELPAEAQQDPARAKRSRRGPDIVQERGKDDKAMFVSPNMDGADVAKTAIDDARESITRVTGQMALSQGTTTVGLGRSADSKKQDKLDEEVVLGAAGKKLIGFGRQVIKLLALGRGEKDEKKLPVATGYQSFDVDDVDDLVNQASLVELVSIPSATFQVEHKYRLACSILGDDLDHDTRQKIRDELQGTITQEQFLHPVVDPTADPDADPDDDDEDADPDAPKKPDPKVDPKKNDPIPHAKPKPKGKKP